MKVMHIEKVFAFIENRLARTMYQGRPVRQISDASWESLKKDLRSLIRQTGDKANVHGQGSNSSQEAGSQELPASVEASPTQVQGQESRTVPASGAGVQGQAEEAPGSAGEEEVTFIFEMPEDSFFPIIDPHG